MKRLTIAQILHQYPFTVEFFQQNRLDITGFEQLCFEDYLEQLDERELEEKAIDPKNLPEELNEYIRQMSIFLGLEKNNKVQSLTILPGHDKKAVPENFDELVILPSQIVAIVGPTGSGKSRLLADIEWAAQRDTPTGRSILINNTLPDAKWRYSPNNKLVAQLSQNMNFVIDLSVKEFLRLHAQSRMAENEQKLSAEILAEANKLAGESFSEDTPVTSLSGGQSRALMIADTAILSASPIVLIDEIENAGIDRRKALELLISQDKIVLMATHDPLLALMADRRIVIRNGGIDAVLETTQDEKKLLEKMNRLDCIMQTARRELRAGKTLHPEKIFV
ncbi:ATP-binding cassette domain-containing protein [Pectinatus haikarae]|uniref:ABC-type lipoprotein export system ATPase subunit n=1 Tax=Pectinatus haikarae TaxID=349096 RepID=A0ABT9Y4B0_9FIRM|nr:ATP-binding cassette domain-containing protein [Pectinatus haikarae]MDQ0202669.1 ABC-type lipoprotein export system ATPase subunit [Pectinatus haikarae]